MAGHFFDDFQSSSMSFATSSLRISVVEFFTFHSPNLAIIREKKAPRIFGFKNSDGTGIGKSYVVLNL